MSVHIKTGTKACDLKECQIKSIKRAKCKDGCIEVSPTTFEGGKKVSRQ